MKDRSILIDFLKIVVNWQKSYITYLINKTTFLLFITQAILIAIFEKFKQVNRSEHGKGANEFNNLSENEGVNCYKPSGIDCLLKCNNPIVKKDFSMEYFEFLQPKK